MGMGEDEEWDIEPQPMSKSDFEFYKSIHKDSLDKVPDVKLLNKILHEQNNKDYINKIVPNKRFPAYTIAERLRKTNKALTTNQRRALTNVLSHYYTLLGV